MPQNPPALKISGLKKRFGGREVLRGISLELRQGRLGALIGRSGCGKSTLLRCLNGLEKPEEGELRLAGLDLRYPIAGHEHPLIHAVRLRAGMVFQNFNLFPHLDALGNVMAGPLRVQGRPEAEARALAGGLLEKVGLGGHASHFPDQLSGGQQQRLAIARALALKPALLLYDEPTASLDPHLTQEVLEVMLQLKGEGLTQLVVTHEHAFAEKAADQVFFMEEGCLIESGPARRFFRAPRDPRTRRFVRGMR